ncbi:glycosyltransferase [Rhodococcus opacus]|uniref:Putative glycosyltransferase n=1 Tax=Rhodococcus opacus (strain B4) TaxID=632772 RepID=C1AWI1_RHOOB|nr:glycosyltransferase [Rhodococcus opacus]BAH53754.1 putative glycosyltransferase [Rhodococcus opacus B4]
MSDSSDQKCSFIILQPHLEYGGAERQTVILANKLVCDGHECHLVLHEAKGGLLVEVDSRVHVHTLGLENHLATPLVAWRLARLLKRLPSSLVIVKLWSSILACAMVDRFVPKHVYNYCEDLDPTDHAKYIRMGLIKQRIIGYIFRNRDHLTANTQTVAHSMVEQYKISLPAVIPSVVDIQMVQRKATEGERLREGRPGALQLVTVGSLIERKGLLYMHRALLESGAHIDWHIVGEGPLRTTLEDLATGTGPLQLHLYSGTSNPYGYMRSADILLHASLSEAFGIVIVESLAVGTPVVAAASIGPTEMRSRLGDRPELLRLFASGDVKEAKQAVTQAHANMESPQPSVAIDYMRPYSLESTAKLWVERNLELTRGKNDG